MTTDKELADALRLAHYELLLRNFDEAAEVLNKRIDELDPPPKPEYPDGTPAWVTNQYGRRYLCTWHAENREWCIGGPDGDSGPGKVTKVEPLRVLADDEIALPRAAFGDACQSEARKYSRGLDEQSGFGHHGSARVWVAYADALDAEAGDQS